MSRKERNAFGPPGIAPKWTSSDKTGVGTSLNTSSKVWFSISHGILNEIYYPQVDQACTRDMGLIVTDGQDFFSEEKRHTSHQVKQLANGVPGYQITNSCHLHSYRIKKEIISDPVRDTVLQRIQFLPIKEKEKDFRLYALLAPHLGNYGTGNTAWAGSYKGLPMLFAQREDSALAMVCSVPWKRSSAGFVGSSDGWQDLKQHRKMDWAFEKAENGNVALIGEVNLEEIRGNNFIIAIGFGRNAAEAGQRARASIFESFESAKSLFINEWDGWHQKLFKAWPEGKVNPPKYFFTSAAMLRSHESKRHPGGLIASLSIPWGFSKGDDDLGGYHLVWPRDMVQTAGGLLAAQANEDARRVLNYLMVTQEEDGHWAQNMWLDGRPYWKGIQMDQTALPILLVDLIFREANLDEAGIKHFWPMIRKAAAYLVANGPVTAQDRWEENAGYSTFTLAVEIASLLVAADHADINSEPQLGAYLREIADSWNDSLERWTYVTGSDLARFVGVEGYYVRINSRESVNEDYRGTDLLRISNRPEGENICPAHEMVSPDALALVRYGLRSAGDERILNTIKVIDATLKMEGPHGSLWYRYNRDGYGEQADGKPFDGSGVGRPWPLLTGERGHYEVAAGNISEAENLLRTMENYANETGLFPEQIWDSESIPEYELTFGRASGAAMPLVWAHAEYIKLCRSIQCRRVFDMPVQTKQRYLVDKCSSNIFVWNFTNQYKYIPKGKRLRIQCLVPATVLWSDDDWLTTNEVHTINSGIGIHYADLPTSNFAYGQKIAYTFYWPESKNWEEKKYSLRIEKDPAAVKLEKEMEQKVIDRDKIKVFFPS